MENLAHVIELWTKIPASKIREEEFQRLSQLEERLKSHIVGQDRGGGGGGRRRAAQPGGHLPQA